MKATIQLVTTSMLMLASSAYAQTAPTDAQIAMIVVTANQVDIDAGKLAETMGSTQEVRDFGRRMVLDHSGVNQKATALVKKLNVTPESGATSASLKKDGDANLAKLKKLEGVAFDRAYLDNEVKYHQAVLDMLNETLIPNAKNAELKTLLVSVRPAFESHLEHAKQLQTKIGN